jgi:hypothetical protein
MIAPCMFLYTGLNASHASRCGACPSRCFIEAPPGNHSRIMTEQAAAGAEELRGANPLVMLLRSLLPWVNVGQQPDYGAEGGHDEAQDGPGPPAGGAE